jgi:hypothetical protein
MADIVRSRAPLVYAVKMKRGDRMLLRAEALRLPVESADRANTWVLSGLFYYD